MNKKFCDTCKHYNEKQKNCPMQGCTFEFPYYYERKQSAGMITIDEIEKMDGKEK